MQSLKRTVCWTAAPILVTASLGFAGAVFAAPPATGAAGSGSITRPNQSAGTPSETVPMSPECKANPSSPKCTEEPHGSSGMSGSDPAGSNGSGASRNETAPGGGQGSTSGNGSGMGNGPGNGASGAGNAPSTGQPPAGDTSRMQPAVPQATTPAVRNGARGNRNEPPNNMSK